MSLADDQLMALNVYEEAGGEPDDGKAAIVKVVLNRMARRFRSDATVAGTILAKDQFSWAWFAFVTKPSGTITPGKHTSQEYTRLCHTLPEAQARAEYLFKTAVPSVLARCSLIAAQVQQNEYPGEILPDDAISYLNPRILTKLPNWAIPSKLVISIGHHDFYRA